jgi:hypothetical protein
MLQPICWLILAGLHVTPALAAVRPALLKQLYRIPRGSPLFLLMQHRAALFSAVVAACVIAAFHPPSRPLAVAVAGISMLSFLILYALAEQPAALKTIARVDLVGLVPLAIVVFLTVRG